MSKGNDLIERLRNLGDRDLSDEIDIIDWLTQESERLFINPNEEEAWLSSQLFRAADTIASLSEALAEAEKKEAAWSDISTEPEVGRKVIALFDDGSGSMMLWRHDDGYVDQEGDEHSAFPPHLFLWRYLPDDFEFWCETTSEPLTLKLPPRDLSQGGQP